jgi:hypothetical protein
MTSAFTRNSILHCLLPAILCLIISTSQAQTAEIVTGSINPTDSISKRHTNYDAEVGILASSKSNTPFWLHANQFGSIPLHNPAGLARVSLTSGYHKKTWDLGYGIEAWGFGGKESKVFLSEAYVKGKYRKLEIWGGRRKQIIGIVGDSLLTSGSYIQSGNSLPIPQIQIGFTDYVKLFKGLISFKGMLSHGWFDGNTVVKDHYLHQKAVYLKFGKERWPVRLAGGFNHNVQWGGKVVLPNRHTIGERYPSELVDFWYVVSGKRIPTFGFVDPEKYDVIDRGNRVGNHLGSLDLSVEINLLNTELVIYKQFIYDDGSLYYKKGLEDGLNGISIKFKKDRSSGFQIKAITAEFLNTANQGGSSFTLDGSPRGKDDYFNHIQYSGWVYNKNTIGTAFIVPKEQTEAGLPRNSVFKFSNNTRLKLFHLGLAAQLNRINFTLKASYSDNLGTYERPFPSGTRQLSLLLDTSIPLQTKLVGAIDLKIMLASDTGKLYENSTGARISISKRGLLGQ